MQIFLLIMAAMCSNNHKYLKYNKRTLFIGMNEDDCFGEESHHKKITGGNFCEPHDNGLFNNNSSEMENLTISNTKRRKIVVDTEKGEALPDEAPPRVVGDNEIEKSLVIPSSSSLCENETLIYQQYDEHVDKVFTHIINIPLKHKENNKGIEIQPILLQKTEKASVLVNNAGAYDIHTPTPIIKNYGSERGITPTYSFLHELSTRPQNLGTQDTNQSASAIFNISRNPLASSNLVITAQPGVPPLLFLNNETKSIKAEIGKCLKDILDDCNSTHFGLMKRYSLASGFLDKILSIQTSVIFSMITALKHTQTHDNLRALKVQTANTIDMLKSFITKTIPQSIEVSLAKKKLLFCLRKSYESIAKILINIRLSKDSGARKSWCLLHIVLEVLEKINSIEHKAGSGDSLDEINNRLKNSLLPICEDLEVLNSKVTEIKSSLEGFKHITYDKIFHELFDGFKNLIVNWEEASRLAIEFKAFYDDMEVFGDATTHLYSSDMEREKNNNKIFNWFLGFKPSNKKSNHFLRR